MMVLINSSFIDQLHTTSNKDKLVCDNKNRPDNNRAKFKLVDNPLYLGDNYIFEKNQLVFKCFKLNIVNKLLGIFYSTRHYNSFIKDFGGLKYERMS